MPELNQHSVQGDFGVLRDFIGVTDYYGPSKKAAEARVSLRRIEEQYEDQRILLANAEHGRTAARDEAFRRGDEIERLKEQLEASERARKLLIREADQIGEQADLQGEECRRLREQYQALLEAVAEAMTSLATGPMKDGYAYSVLEEATTPSNPASEPKP